MFAFGDILKFEREQEAYKILKPIWVAITDRLVLFLGALSIFFGGIQLTSGTFVCLAAVDCPGMSRENMKSSWFANMKHRNACENYYTSQKSNNIPGTVVITDLEKSIYYANFVNSECSKSAVPGFLSYFGVWLFLEAFFVIIVDKPWLIVPDTASVLESFVSLVMECNKSPFSDSALTHALSDLPHHEDQQQPRGSRTDTVNILSHNDNENDELFDTNTTDTMKSLFDKVDKFAKTLRLKRCKIWHLYLLQAILQVVCVVVCLSVNISGNKDLTDIMKCTLTQHIPVDHDYFICSHNLARGFVFALTCLYFLWGITLLLFIGKMVWTVWTLVGKEFHYVFNTATLPSLKETVPSVDHDLSFLLHLLESYNKSYVVRFAYFLEKENYQRIKDYQDKNKRCPLGKSNNGLDVVEAV